MLSMMFALEPRHPSLHWSCIGILLAVLLRNPVLLWLGSALALAILGGWPLCFGGEAGVQHFQVTRVKSSADSLLEAGLGVVDDMLDDMLIDGTFIGAPLRDHLGDSIGTVLTLLPHTAYVMGLSL